MTTEERKEFHEERSLNIKHRSPLLNLLGLWLTHAGDQVDIPLPKLIVHMSPMEVASAENEFQKNCIMEAMADYILDGLAAIVYDEGYLKSEKEGPGLNDKQIANLQEDYEFWCKEVAHCGAVEISSDIEKFGNAMKVIWSATIKDPADERGKPRSGGVLELTETTANLGPSALKENAYASNNCNARHVLRGARRMAFRSRVASLFDDLSCDKREFKAEAVTERMRDFEER